MSFTVFCIAFAATLLGSLSGGSASAISVPCWLSFGIPLPTAIACDKVCATLWTVIVSRNYLKRKNVDGWLLLGLSIFGLAGAVVGARITSGLDPLFVKRIVGSIIVALVALCWLRKDFGVVSRPPTVNKWTCSVLGLPLGLYEGFLGSGNTVLSSLLLCRTRGHDLITALGHYYFLAFIWCAAAAATYISQGFFNWSLTIPAACGSVLGGLIGSSFAGRVGAGPVKVLFSIAGLLFGVKLIVGV